MLREYFIAQDLREWSLRALQPYRPYSEIQLRDLLGVGRSSGFVLVYSELEALKRNHPHMAQEATRCSGEMGFMRWQWTRGTCYYPTILRAWTSEYFPTDSIGFYPAYGTHEDLVKDIPACGLGAGPGPSWGCLDLYVEEFRLPIGKG